MNQRRSPGRRPVLLNDEGQQHLEDAFAKKVRSRTSFADFANGYVRALEQEGHLLKYLRDDIDPYEVLEWLAEHGG